MADRVQANDADDKTNNGASASTPLSDQALAPSTREVYDRAARQFDDWRDGRPPTDALVADYLSMLFKRGLSPVTAGIAVAALAKRAEREGVPSPIGTQTKLTLAGFRREGAERGTGQAVGIMWEQADRMAELAENTNTNAGLRDALLTRIMSDGLLRVAEAAALQVADIAFVDDWLSVFIRRSKTDQEGAGAVKYAGPPTAGLARQWLEAAGIEDGPLFRRVNKADVVQEAGVGARRMRDIIKNRAADAGIEGRVSGHSFRIGTAQSLRRAGTDDTELMEAGRWKRVETMARYVRTQDAALGPVARHRYGVEPPDGVRHGSATPRRCCCREPQVDNTAALATEELSRITEEVLLTRNEAKKVRKMVAQLEKAVVGSTKADLRTQSQTVVPLGPFGSPEVPCAKAASRELGRSRRSTPQQSMPLLRAPDRAGSPEPFRPTIRVAANRLARRGRQASGC
ncbi:MAG: tyrosine-type recombinase/integrase [Gammaproteobacteria bacterium]|nr:tyrosine-type recombinase/integrase [Gammaproteobacteria bacterium]